MDEPFMHGENLRYLRRRDQPRLPADEVLMRAWRNGLDTAAIASKHHCKEADVHNRLWYLRQLARDERAG